MKKIRNKLNGIAFDLYCKKLALTERANEVLSDERGDTNFLSIIIILAIVLVLAVIFIAFKDDILKLVGEAWDSFQNAFNNQDKTIVSGGTP